MGQAASSSSTPGAKSELASITGSWGSTGSPRGSMWQDLTMLCSRGQLRPPMAARPPIRVLHVIPRATSGGVERRRLELARGRERAIKLFSAVRYVDHVAQLYEAIAPAPAGAAND